MQKTRRQILDFLKLRGRATLDELAREIGLSAVTIRSHLSVLERDDLITSEEVRGKVGRPHFVYFLAEGADELFPASYDLIALRFLDGFRAVATPEQMEQVVQIVAERWAAENTSRMQGKDLEERVSEVARIRTEEGAMAEWEPHEGGFQLRQHHCPTYRIAHISPEICQAELLYLRRLLGVSVERECPHAGDLGKCFYRITA